VTLLQINNLHTTLQSGTDLVRAVRGIDLQVNYGETVCLVGESGSGKSITALSIMGLLPAGIASHPHGEVLLSAGRDQWLDLLNVTESVKQYNSHGRILHLPKRTLRHCRRCTMCKLKIRNPALKSIRTDCLVGNVNA